MKTLIDKVGGKNLIVAVIVGLGVATVVLAVTGELPGGDNRPASETRTARPRPSAEATASPHSFPDAPADEGSAETTQRYGGQRRSSGGYYDPGYYEYDDDAAEAYYGYYGYPYEDDDDDGTYVPPPPEDRGGSGTDGEPGRRGYPYGDDDSGGGVGGDGGPGGSGG